MVKTIIQNWVYEVRNKKCNRKLRLLHQLDVPDCCLNNWIWSRKDNS